MFQTFGTFLFRLHLDAKMFGAFYKSKNRHQLKLGNNSLDMYMLSCPEKKLIFIKKLTSHLCHVLANCAYF